MLGRNNATEYIYIYIYIYNLLIWPRAAGWRPMIHNNKIYKAVNFEKCYLFSNYNKRFLEYLKKLAIGETQVL